MISYYSVTKDNWVLTEQTKMKNLQNIAKELAGIDEEEDEPMAKTSANKLYKDLYDLDNAYMMLK